MTSAELRASLRVFLANPDCRGVSFVQTNYSCGYIQVKSTEFVSQEVTWKTRRKTEK